MLTLNEDNTVRSLMMLNHSPDDSGTAVIFLRDLDSYSGAYYDWTTETLRPIFATDAGVSLREFEWSSTDHFFAYHLRTNHANFEDITESQLYVVDVNTGEAILSISQVID